MLIAEEDYPGLSLSLRCGWRSTLRALEFRSASVHWIVLAALLAPDRADQVGGSAFRAWKGFAIVLCLMFIERLFSHREVIAAFLTDPEGAVGQVNGISRFMEGGPCTVTDEACDKEYATNHQPLSLYRVFGHSFVLLN